MIKQVPVYIFKSPSGSPLKVPPPPIPDGSVAKTFNFTYGDHRLGRKQ